MDNFLEQNRCDLNIDFPIPDKENKSFQSIFTFIRKKLQIKASRKNHIDSLLKKSKGKFFRAIYEGIKLCLNLRVYRLPQEFITNITIEYNKKFLHKTIIEIYKDFNLLPSLEDIINKNLCRKGKIEIFKEIANSDFYSLYNNYICSDRFKRDYEDLKKEEGKRNGILFEFAAKNFCVYYFFQKGHSLKEKKFNGKNYNNNEKDKKIIFKISSIEQNYHSNNKNNSFLEKNGLNIFED